MTAPQAAVAIVGAGPVGLTAAAVLARRGIQVTVLESGAGLATESRASTFHPPTLEMLSDLGAYDEVAERGLLAPTFQYRDRERGLISELDLALLADDTDFPFRIQLEQSKLTAILLPRVEAAGVQVVFEWPVAAVTQDDAGVTMTSTDGRTARADWVIGADGARSAVRKSLGIDFAGMTYPESFLVISTPEPLEEHVPGIALVNYVFDREEWAVFLRTPGHWRILIPVSEDMADAGVTDQFVQQRLKAVRDLGRPWEVAHLSLYRVHQRVVERMRDGRVLLAGDAAHVNNPLGGMGMNSGLHDAVLLASALADLLDGSNDEAALDAVAAERRRIALEVVGRTTHATWQKMRNPDETARSEVFADLAATAADPLKARESLLASSMLTQLTVADRRRLAQPR